MLGLTERRLIEIPLRVSAIEKTPHHSVEKDVVQPNSEAAEFHAIPVSGKHSVVALVDFVVRVVPSDHIVHRLEGRLRRS